MWHLNKYKIPFAQSNYGVFSETASRTGTCDIAVDSAWFEGGHWPINKSIQWLWCWFPGQELVAVWYGRNLCLASIWQIIWILVKNVHSISKCFFFSISNSALIFVMFCILNSGKLAGHVVRKSAKIWTRGFFMEALCPGRSYTNSRATTGLSSS